MEDESTFIPNTKLQYLYHVYIDDSFLKEKKIDNSFQSKIFIDKNNKKHCSDCYHFPLPASSFLTKISFFNNCKIFSLSKC